MNDNFDSYYFDDGMEDSCSNCSSWDLPNYSMIQRMILNDTSWDGLEASSDDWLDTMLWIKSLKEVK